MSVDDGVTPTHVDIIRTFREDGIQAGIDRCQDSIDSLGTEAATTILYYVAYPISAGSHRDKYAIAKSLLEMCVQVDQDDSILHDMLAEMYLRLAIEQYRRAAELDGGSWGTLRVLEQIQDLDLDFY